MLATLTDLHQAHGRLAKPHYVSITTPLLKSSAWETVLAYARLCGGLSANHTSVEACELAIGAQMETGCNVAMFIDHKKWNINLPGSNAADVGIHHAEGAGLTPSAVAARTAIVYEDFRCPQVWYHTVDYTLSPEGGKFSDAYAGRIIGDMATVDLYSRACEANVEMLTRTAQHPSGLPVMAFVPFGFVGMAQTPPEKAYTYPAYTWRDAADTYWTARACAMQKRCESVYLWDLTKPGMETRKQADLRVYVAGFNGVTS